VPEIMPINYGSTRGIVEKKSSAQITEHYSKEELPGKIGYRCGKFPAVTGSDFNRSSGVGSGLKR
jgi:hypothetical protein